jgi:hypothetical protein
LGEAVILTATEFVYYENGEHPFDEILAEMPEFREVVNYTKNRAATQFSKKTWGELKKADCSQRFGQF